MRDIPTTLARFQTSRKLSDEAIAAELHVTSGAFRHWKAGRRAPKLWTIYRSWSFYGSALAGALLAELCPEFRDAIAEQERR